jgi:PhnB protein
MPIDYDVNVHPRWVRPDDLMEPTMQLNTYLTFDNHCREALTFYQKCLGGEIMAMMPWGESPMCDEIPPEAGDLIMHGCLVVDGQMLMASDSFPGRPYDGVKGAAVTINVDTDAEAKQLYTALSEDGAVEMELQETFWASSFAAFNDRFGVPWMINCNKEVPDSAQ